MRGDFYMMDIRRLEKERINKINNLSLDEIKAYIENINLKQWEGYEEHDYDKVRFYGDKLKEIFEVTSDRWINLDFYSLGVKFKISGAKRIENDTKAKIHEFSYMSQLILNAEMRLINYSSILRHILFLYYSNHSPRDYSLVEDLILNLNFEYDFKNEDFEKYAKGVCRESDDLLMNGFDNIIEIIKRDIEDIIDSVHPFIKNYDESNLEELSENIREEKDYVIKMADSDEGMKALYDGDYLDLLLKLLKVSKIYDDSCKSYMRTRDMVLDFINSDDGFMDIKLMEYEHYIKSFPDMSCDKEAYISIRPKYDMKDLRFIPSE